MTKIYCFVGSVSYIGRITLDRFGAKYKIDEGLATSAQKGGAAILEESDFNAIGFTADELKIWADPFMGDHDIPNNPADCKAKEVFINKKLAARAKFAEIRQALVGPEDRHIADVPAMATTVLIERYTEVPEVVTAPKPIFSAQGANKHGE